MASTLTDTSLTVRDLRRRWRPHKLRLAEENESHPTCIRFHRACSWLARVEQLEGNDYDLALISQWIAFNALYGQWNEFTQEPQPDRECWREFVSQCLRLDKDSYLADTLRQNKRLVVSLAEDEYLSSFFWKSPCPGRADKARGQKHKVRSWFVEANWTLLLDNVLDRIYLMRCQLVHGAATHGGKLNRTSLRRCSVMLGHLLPAMLLVVIDHGADEDWGPMCYPPMGEGDSGDTRKCFIRQPK